MALLYSNENFPIPVVEELRRLGHDVSTVFEAGKANQAIADEEVFAFAVGVGRIVLTINRKHFVRLHKHEPKHAGMIVCTQDLDFAGQAMRIDEAIKRCDSLASKLLKVNRPQ